MPAYLFYQSLDSSPDMHISTYLSAYIHNCLPRYMYLSCT